MKVLDHQGKGLITSDDKVMGMITHLSGMAGTLSSKALAQIFIPSVQWVCFCVWFVCSYCGTLGWFETYWLDHQQGPINSSTSPTSSMLSREILVRPPPWRPSSPGPGFIFSRVGAQLNSWHSWLENENILNCFSYLRRVKHFEVMRTPGILGLPSWWSA